MLLSKQISSVLNNSEVRQWAKAVAIVGVTCAVGTEVMATTPAPSSGTSQLNAADGTATFTAVNTTLKDWSGIIIGIIALIAAVGLFKKFG